MWQSYSTGSSVLKEYGIIHLVSTQNIPKNQHFLHLQGIRNVTFSENFASVLNEWPLKVCFR